MVDDDRSGVVGDKGLQFSLQFLDEGGIVVDGDVGYHIDGNATLILEVVEAMDLLDVLVGGIDSWGARPLEQYRLPAIDRTCSFTITPIVSN